MRKVIAATAFVLAAACAHGGGNGKVEFPQPDVTIAQVADSANILFSRGPVNLRYILTVHNNSGESITLQRVDLRTFGGGLYNLPNRSTNLTTPIAGNATVEVPLSVWGTATGSLTRRVPEPTTLRGVLYYATAGGVNQKSFTETIDLGSGSEQ